ncbi:MAG: ATP-binding protein [Bacteroidota bacterium]
MSSFCQNILGLLLCSLILAPISTLGNDQLFIDSLLRKLERPHDEAQEIFWLNEIAFALKTSEPAQGVSYAQMALEKSQVLQDSQGEARSLYMLGVLNWYLGDLSKAADYLFSSRNLGEQVKDSLGLGRTYNNLGLVLKEEGDDSLASVYFRKSLDVRNIIGDREGMAYSLINLGDIALKKGKKTTALSNYQYALQIAQDNQDEKAMASTYEALSQLYRQEDNLPIARKEMKTALRIREKLDNPYFIASDKIKLGGIYTLLGEQDSAEVLIGEGVRLSRSIQAARMQLEGIEALAQMHARFNAFEEAHACMLKASMLKDSIYNEERANGLEQMKTSLELRIKDKELKIREQEQEVFRLQNYFILTILLGVLLVGGLTAVFFLLRIQSRHNQDLRVKNDEIERSNRELMRSNSELEDFAHAVSHDLKQPLRTIGSFSTLLVKKFGTSDDPDLKMYLDFIIDGIHQMNRLLTDLLIYASVGQNEQAFGAVDLNEIVLEVKQQLNRQINDSRAQIKVDHLPMIQGRRSSMRQLFQNLISNAIKFKGKEVPQIEIGYKEHPNYHLIWVKDNGIGIDISYQKQIFKAFQRLHTQDEYPGTGLGLAICTKIIYQHKGHLHLKSQPQEGATFFIELPKKSV